MGKLLTIICFLFLFCFNVSAKGPAPKAQVKVKHRIVLQIDSSNVSLRKFNAVELNKYAQSSDFEYDTSVKKDQSWWGRFWEWIWETIARLFGNSNSSHTSSNPFFGYFLLIVLVIALVYIIIKSIGLENIFGKNSKQINIPYSESLENIHEITFDQEIEKALTQRNYKLAVRLLYLQCLKQLNDARLIQWQIDKTNNAYLNELTDAAQRQVFSVLTRQFEYVWYGDFAVDGRSFQNINTLFIDFKKMMP